MNFRRYTELSNLPLPNSVEDIYRYVPEQFRFSLTLPEYTRSQIDSRFLAIFDWIYYKNCVIGLDIRDEVFFETKASEMMKAFLKFMNIPFPNGINYFSLRRLIRSFNFIWKYKVTLSGFYAYLKALFGDYFYCEISVIPTKTVFFSYYNPFFNNQGFYTASSGNPSVSYFASLNSISPLYKVTINIFTKISDEDILFIRSIIPNFILFFKDTGNNITINKSWLTFRQ